MGQTGSMIHIAWPSDITHISCQTGGGGGDWCWDD